MPLYHFHIHNGLGFVEDEEGRDLPGLDAARDEGLKGIRSIVAEEIRQGRLDLGGRLELTDEDGRLLLTIGFADAVELVLPADPPAE